MSFFLNLKPHWLRVFSAWFTNLSAGWLGSLLIAREFWVLTVSLVFSLISLGIALAIEKELGEL